jgi:histidinol-phosphatase (PHP family)
MGKTSLFDNHNHSQFSFDGQKADLELSARRASELGLGGICFTDHCDLHVPLMKQKYEPKTDEEFEVEKQQSEIDRVKAVLLSEGSPLKIFKGVEIGVYRDVREKIGRYLEENTFDEVIASVHYLDDTDPYWGEYYLDKTFKEAYGGYLEALYTEMKWLGDRFDIMGHYDYITRYAPYPEASILYKDFPDLLDEILRFLAEEGKALEINTKTYRELKGRLPVLDPDILKRYIELGGEFVSLGSDSHKPDGVGFNFQDTAEYLVANGIRYGIHFENRNPVVTPLR